MKELLKCGLINLLGYERFLLFVSQFRTRTFRLRSNQEDFRYFSSLIPKGCTILDIGANIGVTTCYLATHCPNNTIFSFEPIPPNFNTLEKMVKRKRLSNVKVFNVGIGEKESEVPMILPVVNGIKRHTLAQVLDNNSYYASGEKYNIAIKPIDTINELSSQNIKAIKIDVEGYEYAVLKGAVDTIKRHKPIIFCELTNTPNSHEAVRLLSGMNYQLKMHHSGRLVNTDLDTSNRVDFFFLPG
jgi:FkbM family methyltransferase